MPISFNLPPDLLLLHNHPVRMRNRLTLLALGLALHAVAQVSEGGLPPSFSPESAFSLSGKIPAQLVLPALNTAQAWAEDDQTPGQNRFAAPVTANISLNNAGFWTTLPNGDQVWLCTLRSPGALGLVLMFDEFKLPAGAKFFASTPDGQRVFGAYTAQSTPSSGKFLIGVIPGDQALLEYRVPAGVQSKGRIHLNRVDYAYDKNALKNDTPDDFGQSLPCNINVNCPLGANYQIEKKGVARILMVFSNGSGWCSGSLIANTSGSLDPYFLTAHHCQLIGNNPDFGMWRFDFDYEGVGCSNPGVEPQPKSVLGCERLSFRQATDFLLLKLETIPSNFGVYFNGWSRDTTNNVAKTVFIHHPVGDIKKISQDTNKAIIHNASINWSGQFGTTPPNSHWKVIPDYGIYQGGSSGCPLFDTSKRIVGQLHGGNANAQNACLILNSYFGRFDLSWNQGTAPETRLKDWLDPTNTNALTQNGYVQPAPTFYSVSGNVSTYSGSPIPSCKVFISGGTTGYVYTDTLGNYLFPNIPAGGSYTITPVRDTNDINGVSTFDLVLITNHILGTQALDSPWKIIAADVNHNNSVTTFDVVEARKLILGIYSQYPSNTAWRFFPAGITFGNPQNPFASALPLESILINNLQANFTAGSFKGVKVGDANNSASPGN